MNVEALKELLYKMADDQLILGHRNSEWTGFEIGKFSFFFDFRSENGDFSALQFEILGWKLRFPDFWIFGTDIPESESEDHNFSPFF